MTIVWIHSTNVLDFVEIKQTIARTESDCIVKMESNGREPSILWARTYSWYPRRYELQRISPAGNGGETRE